MPIVVSSPTPTPHKVSENPGVSCSIEDGRRFYCRTMPHCIRLTTATRAMLNAIMAGSAAEEPVWRFRICELAGLAPGIVYPILDRLKEANWVSASWEAIQPADHLRRRFYEMTAGDRSELAGAIAARPCIGRVWGQLAWSRRSLV